MQTAPFLTEIGWKFQFKGKFPFKREISSISPYTYCILLHEAQHSIQALGKACQSLNHIFLIRFKPAKKPCPCLLVHKASSPLNFLYLQAMTSCAECKLCIPRPSNTNRAQNKVLTLHAGVEVLGWQLDGFSLGPLSSVLTCKCILDENRSVREKESSKESSNLPVGLLGELVQFFQVPQVVCVGFL